VHRPARSLMLALPLLDRLVHRVIKELDGHLRPCRNRGKCAGQARHRKLHEPPMTTRHSSVFVGSAWILTRTTRHMVKITASAKPSRTPSSRFAKTTRNTVTR
jgi:hypothetical protein